MSNDFKYILRFDELSYEGYKLGFPIGKGVSVEVGFQGSSGGFGEFATFEYKDKTIALKFFYGVSEDNEDFNRSNGYAKKEYDALNIAYRSCEGKHSPIPYGLGTVTPFDGQNEDDTATRNVIVEEFVSGSNLKNIKKYLNEKGITNKYEQALRIGLSITEALNSITKYDDTLKSRVIYPHRDVKDANMRFCINSADKEITCILLDWGQVHKGDFTEITISTEHTHRPITSQYVGAPEMFYLGDNEYKKATRRQPSVDSWSVAATMYYVVTGGYPYQNELKAIWQPDSYSVNEKCKKTTEVKDPVSLEDDSSAPYANELKKIIYQATLRDPAPLNYLEEKKKNSNKEWRLPIPELYTAIKKALEPQETPETNNAPVPTVTPDLEEDKTKDLLIEDFIEKIGLPGRQKLQPVELVENNEPYPRECPVEIDLPELNLVQEKDAKDPISLDNNDEKPALYDVVLSGFGDRKISVVKAVHELTGHGLSECFAIVNGHLPVSIRKGICLEEAKRVQKFLRDAGGSVSIVLTKLRPESILEDRAKIHSEIAGSLGKAIDDRSVTPVLKVEAPPSVSLRPKECAHSFGEALIKFASGGKSATATKTCKDCGHKVSEKCTVTSTYRIPTCTERGKITYTAKGLGAVASKTVIGESAIGHHYATPRIEFAADGKSATASKTCKDCGHKVSEKCTVTSRIAKQPTCTEPGETKYTAKGLGAVASKTIADIPTIEHLYTEPKIEFAANGKSATASKTCRDCGHKVSEKCTVTSTIVKQPTCTEPGETKYTAKGLGAVASKTAIVYLQVGDIVTFGRYPQTNEGDIAPIEWQVLDKKEGKVLLISKFALDYKPYHKHLFGRVNWTKCSLRSWLNNDFYRTAFNHNEKLLIYPTYVKADNKFGTDTLDNVFLLAVNEARGYFTTVESRICDATDYAIAKGASDDEPGSYAVTTSWWLRTTALEDSKSSPIMYVNSDGIIPPFSGQGAFWALAVRPAIWVKLDDEPK